MLNEFQHQNAEVETTTINNKIELNAKNEIQEKNELGSLLSKYNYNCYRIDGFIDDRTILEIKTKRAKNQFEKDRLINEIEKKSKRIDELGEETDIMLAEITRLEKKLHLPSSFGFFKL
jgi:hypothetical protein